jgi:hypothetical protein
MKPSLGWRHARGAACWLAVVWQPGPPGQAAGAAQQRQAAVGQAAPQQPCCSRVQLIKAGWPALCNTYWRGRLGAPAEPAASIPTFAALTCNVILQNLRRPLGAVPAACPHHTRTGHRVSCLGSRAAGCRPGQPEGGEGPATSTRGPDHSLPHCSGTRRGWGVRQTPPAPCPARHYQGP